jgi:hypothetical protein
MDDVIRCMRHLYLRAVDAVDGEIESEESKIGSFDITGTVYDHRYSSRVLVAFSCSHVLLFSSGVMENIRR